MLAWMLDENKHANGDSKIPSNALCDVPMNVRCGRTYNLQCQKSRAMPQALFEGMWNVDKNVSIDSKISTMLYLMFEWKANVEKHVRGDVKNHVQYCKRCSTG